MASPLPANGSSIEVMLMIQRSDGIARTSGIWTFFLRCMSPELAVRPDGANHQVEEGSTRIIVDKSGS